MNRLKFFILAITFTAVQFSCSKEEKVLSSNTLEGQWELRTEISGQTGVKTNYEINNGRILQFTANEYQVIADHKTIKKGSYTVEKK